MIRRFNVVSAFVATEILRQDQLKNRVATLAKFIEVAEVDLEIY
jgi:hypothetical protein